jgi:anti-anti-sigma factor
MTEMYCVSARRPSGRSVWHDERVEPESRISIDTLPSGWSVNGELDASTSPSLAAACAELPPGGGQVDVDLGGVTFIDSSGLRILIALSDRAAADGRKVVVVSASNPVRRLLEITGLESMFGVISDDSAPANP